MTNVHFASRHEAARYVGREPAKKSICIFYLTGKKLNLDLRIKQKA